MTWSGTSQMKPLLPRSSDDLWQKLSQVEPIGVQGPRSSPSAASLPGAEADCPGPWLRAWVEFQVDARINQAFRDLAEGELLGNGRPFDGGDRLSRISSNYATVTVEQASQAASEAKGLCHKLEEEVRLVARAQSHILGTLEGISERVDLTASGKGNAQVQDSTQLDKDVATRLESRIIELREEAAHHQHQCSDKLASALDVLATTQREVGVLAQAVDRLGERSNGSAISTSADKPVDRFLIDEAEARFEARCERLDRDLVVASKARSTLEGRFEELRTELASAVVTREDFRQGLEDLATDFAEAMATLKGEVRRVSHFKPEHDKHGLEERIELWQAALQKEIEAQQKRLVTDLRAEMKSGLRDDTSDLVALDEQLWSTDQRLGQRIDELAHRISLALERLGLEHPPTSTNLHACREPEASMAPTTTEESAIGQEPRAPRRILLTASHGRRNQQNSVKSGEENMPPTTANSAMDGDADQRRLQVSRDELPRIARGGTYMEEAYSSPHAIDRATPDRGASSGFVSRQLSRTATWSTVSDAMATAADALSGGDEEERRQLARLARLERVQVRAVSPVATSFDEIDATAGASGSKQQELDPLTQARTETTRLRIPRYNSTPNSRTKSNSPSKSVDKAVASGSAMTAAAARVARRRGPFLGGAPSS